MPECNNIYLSRLQVNKNRILFSALQSCRSDVEEKRLHGSCCNPTWAVCRAKSFADDLVTERGIVNGRVAPCYDPLRLSLRLEICPPSGWCYIREATAASCGAVASLEALLLCLYLGESSAGCATVCDCIFPTCVLFPSQPASQPLDICARPRFASVHDVHDG